MDILSCDYCTYYINSGYISCDYHREQRFILRHGITWKQHADNVKKEDERLLQEKIERACKYEEERPAREAQYKKDREESRINRLRENGRRLLAYNSLPSDKAIQDLDPLRILIFKTNMAICDSYFFSCLSKYRDLSFERIKPRTFNLPYVRSFIKINDSQYGYFHDLKMIHEYILGIIYENGAGIQYSIKIPSGKTRVLLFDGTYSDSVRLFINFVIYECVKKSFQVLDKKVDHKPYIDIAGYWYEKITSVFNNDSSSTNAYRKGK